MKKGLSILFELIIGFIRVPFCKSRYFIKKGYKHRKNYNYYDDTFRTDEYQNEVYQDALRIANENGYKRIIDIGCGSAYKLMTYFKDFDTTGVDVEDTLKYLKENYPEKKWLTVDEYSKMELSADIVICSDVIEHLEHPEQLLEQIKKIKDVQYIYISTPERNIMHGWYHFGPPSNPHHIREWSGWEFRKFISQYFTIISHSVSNYEQCTQLMVCK